MSFFLFFFFSFGLFRIYSSRISAVWIACIAAFAVWLDVYCKSRFRPLSAARAPITRWKTKKKKIIGTEQWCLDQFPINMDWKEFPSYGQVNFNFNVNFGRSIEMGDFLEYFICSVTWRSKRSILRGHFVIGLLAHWRYCPRDFLKNVIVWISSGHISAVIFFSRPSCWDRTTIAQWAPFLDAFLLHFVPSCYCWVLALLQCRRVFVCKKLRLHWSEFAAMRLFFLSFLLLLLLHKRKWSGLLIILLRYNDCGVSFIRHLRAMVRLLLFDNCLMQFCLYYRRWPMAIPFGSFCITSWRRYYCERDAQPTSTFLYPFEMDCKAFFLLSIF